MQNITALTDYMDRTNRMARLFGNRQLTLDSAADRQRIAERLEGDLSPENLTCDGELRGAELQRRAKFLNACVKELRALK
jgi:hypothetical protein